MIRIVSLEAVPQVRGIVLVDVSGSMRGERSKFDWDFPLDAAENLLSSLPASVEVGLAFFTTELRGFNKPTADRAVLRDELEAMRKTRDDQKGPLQTGMWDMIESGADLLDHPHVGDVVYVITDGGDNRSQTSPDHVAQALMMKGVRLFTLVLADYQGRLGRLELIPAQQELQQVADDTGGSQIVSLRPSYFLRSSDLLKDSSGNPTELSFRLVAQYNQISNVYGLTITLLEALDKPRAWHLGVASSTKPAVKRISLIYPRRLYSCN